MTELVRAKILQDDCPECRNSLLRESESLGGLPLAGAIVLIPKHWLNESCPHGRSGIKFQPDEKEPDPLSAQTEESDFGDVDFGITDSKMDATKNIGYPIRERGPYGSHPGHDDFDDESGPDGPGTY